MDEIGLSTVTPVFQGASFLRDLVGELSILRHTLEKGCYPVRLVEAIFVDDGSIDDSAAVLARLQAEYDWVKVITLARNFGQHPATVAGILQTSGDWVATLDEDLQHPPHFLLMLLKEAVVKQADVMYANAEQEVHGSLFRDITSRGYKAIVSKLTGNPHVRRFSSFRLVRGSVARAAAAVSTQMTYFDIALCWFTNRIVTLPLPLRDIRYRTQRQSGYSLRSLLGHAWRMLLSSEIKLLRAGATIGLLTLMLSIGMSAVTVVRKMAYPETIPVQGWASLFLAILFFGGLSALLVGINLEYMSNMILQMLGRPTFFAIDRSKDRLLLEFLQRKQAA
jgi:glycosyltransferase involved in cell wall biosynthesis